MIHGQFAYATGSAGTVTVPLGASVIAIYAESHDASATMSIFGGGDVLLDGSAGAGNHIVFDMPFPIGAMVAHTGSQDIVFTLTTSYFVAYVLAPSSS